VLPKNPKQIFLSQDTIQWCHTIANYYVKLILRLWSLCPLKYLHGSYLYIFIFSFNFSKLTIFT
jgi:hypothetical protein